MVKKKKKQPRRVLHFSDGVLEEYSTDEEDREERKKKTEEEAARRLRESLAVVDPRTLKWVPWVLHYTWAGGRKFVDYCDYYGEKLAWFLGITSPKYYYEIQEWQRQQAAEERRRQKEDVETRGWREERPGEQPIQLDPTKLPLQ